MQKDDDEMPDLPLYTASTGKVKGGPKKVANVKPTAMKKFSAPKGSASNGGKSSGGLAVGLKGASKVGGKTKAPGAQNFVRTSGGVKKAAAQFSLPKPSTPKQGSMKKVGKRR